MAGSKNSLPETFPGSSVGKESTCNAGDPGSIPGSGRSPGEGIRLPSPAFLGFPGSSAGKESACNAGDLGLIPGLGRSSGEGKGCPLQYSGLENSTDCIVHGVAESRTRLSGFRFHPFRLCSQVSWWRGGVLSPRILGSLLTDAVTTVATTATARLPGG